jgi:hypothetical protein
MAVAVPAIAVIPEVKVTPSIGIRTLEFAGMVKSALPPSQITGVPCLSAIRSVAGEFVMLFAYAYVTHVVVLVTVVPAPVATCAVAFEKFADCVQLEGMILTSPMLATPALIPKAVFEIDPLRVAVTVPESMTA